mgnify:CR=1 FL=1
MIRLVFSFILLVSAAQAFAAKRMLEVQVINVDIGLNDYTDRPTLCLVTGREVSSGRMVGLLEDIGDCFYARQAKRSPEQVLKLPGRYLSPVKEQEMLQHLQAFDSQLEFFWSNAD